MYLLRNKDESKAGKILIKVLLFFFCLNLNYVLPNAIGYRVTKLEFSSFLPVHDQLSVLLEEWCKDVEKRTNGQVKVNYHPSGTLTPSSQTFDSVITGIADIGFSPMGVTPGRFPLTEVIEQPLGARNAYMMTKLSNDFYQTFKPKELEQVKVLFLLSAGPGLLHTKKPVSRLEDLRGLKIRCLGGMASRMLKTLGAVPVVLPTGDTYDALRKGIVDGVVAAWDSLEVLKWGEILHYTTVSYHSAIGAPGFVIMNKARWHSLPPDVQEVLDRMSIEYAERLSKLWDQKDQNTIKMLDAKNHTAIFLSEEEEARWRQAVLPLYEAFIREKSARGLPAVEALNFCREWVEKNVK